MNRRKQPVDREKIEAFLAELSSLCNKHGIHVDAWATQADDSFFGVKFNGANTVRYDIGDGYSDFDIVATLEPR